MAEVKYDIKQVDEHRHALSRDGLVIYAGRFDECTRRLNIIQHQAALVDTARRDKMLLRACG